MSALRNHIARVIAVECVSQATAPKAALDWLRAFPAADPSRPIFGAMADALIAKVPALRAAEVLDGG